MSSNLIEDLPDSQQAQLAQEFLKACESGDHSNFNEILNSGLLPSLSFQDHDGWTPLHHAASTAQTEIVKQLLEKGAIWSMVDNLGYTAGDLAYSINDPETYQLILNQGLRSELLRLTIEDHLRADPIGPNPKEPDTEVGQPGLCSASNNATFLASKLTYKTSPTGQLCCVDEDSNGVMMGWESEIMKQTASRLCAGRSTDVAQKPEPSQFAVLNIGFGLGIIDSYLQSYHPTRHLIVEAHPDVLAYIKEHGWDRKPGVVIYPGRWQSFLQDVEAGSIEADFDAVYWDTFSEDYRDLKQAFESMFSLLSGPQAKFSWFHGLGATSRTLYDIYTELAVLDLRQAGLKTTWHEVEVEDGGQTVWEGIKRRYWDIPSSYRLPICTFDI